MGDRLCDRSNEFLRFFCFFRIQHSVFVTAVSFNVNAEVMLLGLSLYVLGSAFGPLVFGPLSEIYGRNIPLWTGMSR
jgi:MFS family permease